MGVRVTATGRECMNVDGSNILGGLGPLPAQVAIRESGKPSYDTGTLDRSVHAVSS